MAKREVWWVSKRDMTVSGRKVSKGQLIKPAGAPNDHYIFGDSTRWAYRWDSQLEPRLCDTDGCNCLFADDSALFRHREVVHAPERDERERARIVAQADAAERELQPGGDIIEGETTIGGHVVEKIKSGPRGPVPYLGMG